MAAISVSSFVRVRSNFHELGSVRVVTRKVPYGFIEHGGSAPTSLKAIGPLESHQLI